MNSAQLPRPLLREFRRPAIWLAGWGALFLLIAIGSLLPAGELPTVSNGFDKVEHFLGYALLSAYAVMLFERMRPQALAALGVIAFGIAIEFAQSAWTADRLGDSADAMANALGALAGLCVTATPMARWLQRIDARLASGT
ncbi:MAG: VanZ family protein [Lysobacter sp.]